MKKQAYKLLPILLSLTLLVGCKGIVHSSSSNSYDGSNNSIYSSDIPNPSSIPDEEGDLDKIIAEFVSGLNVNIPSVNEYKMLYDVYYYYSYSQYVISAAVSDNGTIESAFNSKCANETSLVSLNDDFYYTVEDYGYMYGDNANEPNMTLSFYTEDGYFYFMLTRTSGAGSLDVSDVDTNWYVDYINFNGFVLGEEFPSRDINISLEIDVNIPAPNADAFPYFFEPEYNGEEGHYAATYYVILEGDQVNSYLNLLKTNGFETKLEENVGQTINWDTFEIEEYTYYTGSAYDANYQIFISISGDENDNTIITFNAFNDVASKDKTSNADWTDEEKALMNSTLHLVLPFMAFGNDYELYDDSDEEWDVLVLEDSYYEDLSADYIAILLANGFKEDKTSYSSPCYVIDNGVKYIEVFVDYYYGNYLEIYFEASKLPPLSSLSLNVYELDIVSGASYQFTVGFDPSNAAQPVTWTSSNNEVATVDQNGKITINENAEVGATASITVSSLSGLSQTCNITVVADVVTGIRFAQDRYNLVKGGDPVKLEYYLLPIGATATEEVTFQISDNSYVRLTEDGYISADNEAIVGEKVTISVLYGSTGIKHDVIGEITESEITHILNQSFFGLKQGESSYKTYTKTIEEDAYYEAQCAATHGIQIRSKNNNSGIIAHFLGRRCASITFTFDTNTYSERTIDIYASNTDFSIADMYDGSATKVGSVTYTQGGETSFTYDFTDDYCYIGFRSNDGAIYFTSIEVVWC